MSGAADAPRRLEPGDADYPERLAGAREPPPTLWVRGDAALLRLPLVALLCSVRVPGDLVLPAYDAARALRDAGAPVAGGFQAPLERDCLDLLLRGCAPLVVAPARSLGALRLPAPWRAAVDGGRMALVSRFEGPRRPTRALSLARNRLVAALASRILVVHAEPGGAVARVVAEALERGTSVCCPTHPANADLALRGASPAERALPAPRVARPAGSG